MTVTRGSIPQQPPIGSSSGPGALEPDGSYYQGIDAPRVDRISPSVTAKRLLAAGQAPRCLTIEGLEQGVRRVDLGDGRSLALEYGVYRLRP